MKWSLAQSSARSVDHEPEISQAQLRRGGCHRDGEKMFESCRTFCLVAKDTTAANDLPDSKSEEGILMGCLLLCLPLIFDRTEPTAVYEVLTFAI